jgi:hypothetical protein
MRCDDVTTATQSPPQPPPPPPARTRDDGVQERLEAAPQKHGSRTCTDDDEDVESPRRETTGLFGTAETSRVDSCWALVGVGIEPLFTLTPSYMRRSLSRNPLSPMMSWRGVWDQNQDSDVPRSPLQICTDKKGPNPRLNQKR